jgi:CRISPR-associated endonuclease Csn1
MLEDEFEAIWDAQAPDHSEVLTEEIKDRLFEVIFHQRPLKKPRLANAACLAMRSDCPRRIRCSSSGGFWRN